MQFQSFLGTRESRKSMPGSWQEKDGYVYAIIYRGGLTKIGSSRNPKSRFTEQTRRCDDRMDTRKGYYVRHDDGRREWMPAKSILIYGPSPGFRALESKLHWILSPVRAYEHIHCEHYDLNRSMQALLRSTFRAGITADALRHLRRMVRAAAPNFDTVRPRTWVVRDNWISPRNRKAALQGGSFRSKPRTGRKGVV